jgi:hypothetical protein
MKRIFVLAAAAAMVVACGGGGRSETAADVASGSGARVCEKACALKKKCNAAADESQCAASCKADKRVQRADNFRPEYVESVSACLDSATCETGPDGRSLVQKCIADAARDFKPTEKVAVACAKFDDLTTRCGGTMPAQCPQKLKALTDQLLDRAITCAEDGSCKAANRCLRELKYAILD